MSTSPMPAAGTYIDMVPGGEKPYRVRVCDVTETYMTLLLGPHDVPPTQAKVTLHWAAAPRGRYELACDIVNIDRKQVEVRFRGEPILTQARNAVRGGGGERIVLRRPGRDPITGSVVDLSEQAVRAHFCNTDLQPGEELMLHIELDDRVVDFRATVHKVGSIRQRLPRPGPWTVEMVALFEEDEQQAKAVRRHVMRHQMQARAKGIVA